jgi:hypothetical protein
MQSTTAREGPGQPSPLAPGPTPLRTSLQIGQERDWTPPPRPTGPMYGQGQPTSQLGPQPSQPASQPAQNAQERVRSVVSGVGQQFSGDRVRRALVAGLRGAARARYFREQGLGEAIRFSLDPQGYRPRPHITVRTPRNVVGLDPDRIEVVEHHQGW